MLKAGVIEEGNGAWGFPVVLVRKKDGEVRFCVDYRALNKITKKDVYPLPRIDETLEALGGAVLFTTLDLRAGYWQIRMAAADRDKTAFTTKRGLYRFVRMPFGLMNAPSTFQRLMNGVLRGLTWVTCLVYLDDIVVFTRGGIERHIVELASVLERLSAAGLTIKMKKCVFATQSMEYLGHELSYEGVRPVDRLIAAVREFPRPKDPVQVKRFVHLAGYYRKFIAAFGSIMAPLTKLLRKKVDWEWTEAQEFAFARMKEILTTKPLLSYPDFRLPFRLVTDASKVGLGACLMQEAGPGWKPVAYASKGNSSAEANYSITELECLAVVWAVKLFRPYLYGRAFTIVTDHAALRWLMTRPSPAGRLHRWSLTLQEYEFEIVYRPGNTNVVADALSRAPATVLVAVGRRSRLEKTDTVRERSGVVVQQDEGAAVAEAPEQPSAVAMSSRPLTRAAKRRAENAADQERGQGQPEQSRDGAVEVSVQPKVTAAAGAGPRQAGSSRRKVAPRQGKLLGKRAANSERRDPVVPTSPTSDAVPAYEGADSLQLTDEEIVAAQERSNLVQTLRKAGKHQGMAVVQSYGLTLIQTPQGRRVILPPALWPKAFKEGHDSVWAGHLRGPHTYARIATLYWWPGMQKAVRSWVSGCQECGSRKVRPREVIPPLRSLRGGEVGDRWALDVAGPFPLAAGGQRYVIAALEYVTRYAVATAMVDHTAESVAAFLLKEVVLKVGPFRELLTDGAPELTGKAIEQLVALMQARQLNPVPYHPQMIGLVERFHKSWKDCVATYMTDERQTDWELWVKYAVYSYNSARHSTVALTPNELMMGRKLRAPNELLRRTAVTEAGDLLEYHERLLEGLQRGSECAEQARVKEQARQAKYYNRRARQKREWRVGDRVWLFRPPRGPKATKFVHSWMGLMRVVEAVGYENFLVRREDKTGELVEFIAHSSFLATYHGAADSLTREAADLLVELRDEDSAAADGVVETRPAAVRAAPARINAAAPAGVGKRQRGVVASTGAVRDTSGVLVELRRRKRRNRAGQYAVEYELQPRGSPSAERRWVSITEYEQLFADGRIVEDP